MRVRPFALFLAGSLLAAPLLVAGRAFAESDADRAAARSLAEAGIAAYKRGAYAEALEKLQRAEALYDAPTHLLYIGQSQEALGQLVEASETYRKLTLVTLPPGAPPAFQNAQTTAGERLHELAPKVPKLVVEVQPAGTKDLAVTLDGQALPAALLGVERPTNPGAHVVEARAPGYEPARRDVKLAPRDRQVVKLALQRGAGAAAPLPPPEAEPGPVASAAPAAAASEELAGADPHARRHDGFYLRLGLGVAPLSTTDKVTGSAGDFSQTISTEVSGTGGSFEASIGGTPAPGLVVAGTILTHAWSGYDFKPEGESKQHSSQSINLSVLGPSVDLYPNPTGGFHVGGTVGYALVSIEADGSTTAADEKLNKPAGFALSPFVGYEFWVAEQWSVGALLRLTYAKVKASATATVETNAGDQVELSVKRDDAFVVPSLAVAATFH